MKILLLGFARRVGKDTFAECLQRIYPDSVLAYAFADQLKDDLNPLALNMFGKNISELSDEEKEIFRPILISYGCAWREINPEHWVEVVAEKMFTDEADPYPKHIIRLYITKDCRFRNEAEYFKDYNGKNCGIEVKVIHIDRIGAPEPTDEEKKNLPECVKLADYHFTWPTLETDDERDAKVREFLRETGLDKWIES